MGVKELARYLVNEVRRSTASRGSRSTTSTWRSSSARCCARSRSRTWATPTSSWASRWNGIASRRRTSGSSPRAAPRPRPSRCCWGSPRLSVHRVVHLRGLLPGDHQGSDRGGHRGQGGQPPRAQGERYHGPPHPRRNRLPRVPSVAHRPGPGAGRGAGAPGRGNINKGLTETGPEYIRMSLAGSSRDVQAKENRSEIERSAESGGVLLTDADH